MQAMIDHTAAVVIGATILLILFALSTRSNDSSVEALQVDLAKTEIRLLVDVVEQDFNNIGSGLGKPNGAISTFVDSSDYTVLRFRALTDTATATPATITYRWRPEGTTYLPDGTPVATYEVERRAKGTTIFFDNATAFDIKLRKDRLDLVPPGSPADSLAVVRYADVEIAMIPPIGTEGVLEQTRWTKRFRPINLDAGGRRLIAAKP